MPNTDRKLRAFLCYASQDKPAVREIYQRLKDEGWITPWLDEEKLELGQPWKRTIENALKSTDVVIIFLSKTSVYKEGFVQRELNYAWDISLEKPQHVIFLIPLRLDEVDVPELLQERQWGNYYGEEKERTYHILLRSLKSRYDQLTEYEEIEKVRLRYDNINRGEYVIGQKYKWIVREKLGEGYSGEVYLAQSENEFSTIGVLKRLSPSMFTNDLAGPASHSQIQKEGEILRVLNGFRGKLSGYEIGVPKLLDCSPANPGPSFQYFIVMEKAPGTKLTDFLSKDDQSITRIILLQAFSSLLLFLDAIHKHGIIWNDIKIDHIFWDPTKKLITIIDWANGQFAELDGVTRDRRFSFDDDYVQFADMAGRVLKTFAPRLLRELEWPDPETWNKNTEIINELRVSLSKSIGKESEESILEYNSRINEPNSSASADIYKNADETEHMMDDAESLFYGGQYAEAVKKYDLVLAIDPNWERAREHRALAVRYLHEGQIPASALPLEVAILYGKAQSVARVGDFSKALELLTQAKEILLYKGINKWAEGIDFEFRLLEYLDAEKIAAEGVRLFDQGEFNAAIYKVDKALHATQLPKYKYLVEQYRQFEVDYNDVSNDVFMGVGNPDVIIRALKKLDTMSSEYDEHPSLQKLRSRLQNIIPSIMEILVQEIKGLKTKSERASTLDAAQVAAQQAKSKIDQVIRFAITDSSVVRLNQEISSQISNLAQLENSLIMAQDVYLRRKVWPSEAWAISEEVRDRFPKDPKVLELQRNLSGYQTIKTILLLVILIIAILLLWFVSKWAISFYNSLIFSDITTAVYSVVFKT